MDSRNSFKYSRKKHKITDTEIDICLGNKKRADISKEMAILSEHPAIERSDIIELSKDHFHLIADVRPDFPIDVIQREVEDLVGRKYKNHIKHTKFKKGE